MTATSLTDPKSILVDPDQCEADAAKYRLKCSVGELLNFRLMMNGEGMGFGFMFWLVILPVIIAGVV